jgi:cbb3-type cytochrome oxidase subunit 3
MKKKLLLTLLQRTTKHLHLGTTGALIPNNAPPSSEQKSSNRCGWPLILGILFTMFSILVLAFLFIPRRHNPSFYNEYGFRGGLIRAITFTGITFGAMAVFVITCVVVLLVRKRKRNRTDAT